MERPRASVCMLLLAVGTAAFSSSEDHALTLDMIGKIESNIAMPKGARSLDAYARYYTMYAEKGSQILHGVFVLESKQSGVHIVERSKMPGVFDGGCLVVNFKYDLATDRVIEVFCNGVA